MRVFVVKKVGLFWLVKLMIDEIIEERFKGNPRIKEMTRTKLILKGFN